MPRVNIQPSYAYAPGATLLAAGRMYFPECSKGRVVRVQPWRSWY